MNVQYNAKKTHVSIGCDLTSSELTVWHHHPRKLTSKAIKEMGGLEAATKRVKDCLDQMVSSYESFEYWGINKKHLIDLNRHVKQDKKLHAKLQKKMDLIVK